MLGAVGAAAAGATLGGATAGRAAGAGALAAGLAAGAGDVAGAAGAADAAEAAAGADAAGRGAAVPGRPGPPAGDGVVRAAATPLEPLVEGSVLAAGLVAGNASRNLRTTGASMVEDGDLTNSPMSVSFAMISLLVLPSSFASSCTRALPATALLRDEGWRPVGTAR